MIPQPGVSLDSRYQLGSRIALGGMGEVWNAVDLVLDRPVAVKILRPELAADGTFHRRFRVEARTAAKLSHGGIAAVYDYGEALGTSFLVMELVPGEPLSALIGREGALGTDRTLNYLAQTARALHAAHLCGVVHRDVKPANIMITPDGRVKMTDFGIARPHDHEPLTATGQVMGTAHYLAPEVARGHTATPLSDVYALGVVTYECVAGWRPFDGVNQVAVATAHLQEQPPPLPDTVPEPVRDAVAMAMAKDPTARPQGADVFAGILESLRHRNRALVADLGARGGTRTAGASPAQPLPGGTRAAARASGTRAAGPAGHRAAAAGPGGRPAAPDNPSRPAPGAPSRPGSGVPARPAQGEQAPAARGTDPVSRAGAAPASRAEAKAAGMSTRTSVLPAAELGPRRQRRQQAGRAQQTRSRLPFSRGQLIMIGVVAAVLLTAVIIGLLGGGSSKSLPDPGDDRGVELAAPIVSGSALPQVDECGRARGTVAEAVVSGATMQYTKIQGCDR